MLAINQLKPGVTLELDGDVFLITEVNHVKPGKGAAFVRTRLRHLVLGTVIERTFRASDRLQEAFIETKPLKLLYRSGDTYHFMDQSTFDEVVLAAAALGGSADLLAEEMDVTIQYHKGRLLSVSLPTFIEVTIADTEPGSRGDTVKTTLKPARTATGAVLQVPLFVGPGDRIKLDTRTRAYVERV